MSYTVRCPGCGIPQRVLYIPAFPGTRDVPPEPADWDYILPRECACVLIPEQSDNILASVEAQGQGSERPPLEDLLS